MRGKNLRTLALILNSASSAIVIILHRFVLEHVRSPNGAQDKEQASMSPALPLFRVGSGNEINISYDLVLYILQCHI